eukprot:jgi/Tetstr1/437310/TSEL_002794.t1
MPTQRSDRDAAREVRRSPAIPRARASGAAHRSPVDRLDARFGLSPDSRMQHIEEANPELECESGGRDGEGGSDEDEVQHSDGLRDCCVPGCNVGMLIDSTRSQHRCRECQGHFHAHCAYSINNSDDLNYCGCQHAPLIGGVQAEEPNSAPAGGAGDLSAAATTPQRREDSGGEREGEDGGDDSDVGSRRSGRRKRMPCQRSKRAREQKKSGKATGEEVSPHEAVPEYRVAAGLPTMEASDRAPAVTVHEIARLVHTLCDPDEKHKKHYDALVDWVDKRPEAENKVGRLKP